MYFSKSYIQHAMRSGVKPPEVEEFSTMFVPK